MTGVPGRRVSDHRFLRMPPSAPYPLACADSIPPRLRRGIGHLREGDKLRLCRCAHQRAAKPVSPSPCCTCPRPSLAGGSTTSCVPQPLQRFGLVGGARERREHQAVAIQVVRARYELISSGSTVVPARAEGLAPPDSTCPDILLVNSSNMAYLRAVLRGLTLSGKRLPHWLLFPAPAAALSCQAGSLATGIEGAVGATETLPRSPAARSISRRSPSNAPASPGLDP